MLLEALVTHRLPGRIRLKLGGLKSDPAALDRLAEGLRANPQVAQVQTNALVGSLLIHHTGGWDELAAWAEAGQLFALGMPPRENVHQRLHRGVDDLTRGLSAVSGEPVELREWLTLGLIGLAIHQALAGNVMVPAASLLWYAFNAARMAEDTQPPAQSTQPCGDGALPPRDAAATTTNRDNPATESS